MDFDTYVNGLSSNDPLKIKLVESEARYENIKTKLLQNISISFDETKVFCTELLNKVPSSDELKLCHHCEDYTFWNTYLTYFRNLAGGIEYKKFDSNKLKKTLENQLATTGTIDATSLSKIPMLYVVDPVEVEKDLNYLYNVADQWKTIIYSNNQNNKVLEASCKEARDQLKLLEKSVRNFPFDKGKFLYKRKERGIILRAKYIYLLAKDVLETYSLQDLTLSIFGKEIVVNEYSIVHIVSRHFAAAAHQHFVDKTYHNEEVHPKKMHLFLKKIFDIYSKHINPNGMSLDKIMFKFKGQLYIIYTSIQQIHLRGVGLHKYRRLNTMFPASEEKKKLEMANGYNEIVVDKDMSIYLVPV
ncbi:hypothetical protein EXU85_00530 [Spirosoma sp. KCTC 42546]|uniref:hypothetical protein n=1 Tax=Spirosoma sp. KCTC 42546 TaxID=2520506 RepID=UPI00115B9F68|nr:hypothetical protein [Spirosoma sp. KCTC 42546]QDK77159.1 hypothetical protein EXU85_00530 [Spirosoma sp. KCTC 42546]